MHGQPAEGENPHPSDTTPGNATVGDRSRPRRERWWHRLVDLWPTRESGPRPQAAAEPRPSPPAPTGRGRADDQSLLPVALASLAMRDLTLVNSLLAFVERLERQEEDPEQLGVLFQIDHLATRMRRNGENLLILAGHDTQSKHVAPVPLLDVVRAAMSEISEYTRVRSPELPEEVAVAPQAADDISHLIAELLDNATAYSSADLSVSVRGRANEDGSLLLEVIDDGIGIPDDRLVQLNQWLAAPPDLDDDIIRHMGLYVVSRLAARQGVGVRLQNRPFSGTTAYIRVPTELLTGNTGVPAAPVGADPTPLPPLARRGPRPSAPPTATVGPNGLPRRAPKRPRRAAAKPSAPTPERPAPERPVTAPSDSGELWQLPRRQPAREDSRSEDATKEETTPVRGRRAREAANELSAGQPPGFAERIRADLDGFLSGQDEAARRIAVESEGNSTSGAQGAREK